MFDIVNTGICAQQGSLVICWMLCSYRANTREVRNNFLNFTSDSVRFLKNTGLVWNEFDSVQFEKHGLVQIIYTGPKICHHFVFRGPCVSRALLF